VTATTALIPARANVTPCDELESSKNLSSFCCFPPQLFSFVLSLPLLSSAHIFTWDFLTAAALLDMTNYHSVATGDNAPPPVEPSALPPALSSDVVLVQGTGAEHAQCARLNADEWRGPLIVQQYMERERYLLDQDLTRNGRATCWILTSTQLPKNPDGTRPILACCETTLARAYVARAGKIETVVSHGIGSVFTRSEHRGKGYAGRMMTELAKHLSTWQQPNGNKASFDVLYSDIGTKFYSRYGWKPFPSTHIHLAPLAPSPYEIARRELPKVADLVAEDLQDLAATLFVEHELEQESQLKPDQPIVAFMPDLEHFAWHHAREDFVSEALELEPPAIKGCIHRPTKIALVWARVFAAKRQDWQLHILHTVIPPAMKEDAIALKALSALLLRAQLEAARWDMLGGVEVWDPSEMIIEAAQSLRINVDDKLEVVHRDQEHVCSLRWAGAGSDVEDVIWKFNEKFAWC
jgi:GNAT superfamily N-acetyltransferase